MTTRREFVQSSALISLFTPGISNLAFQNPSQSTNQLTREELVSVLTEDDLVMTGLQVAPDRPVSRSF